MSERVPNEAMGEFAIQIAGETHVIRYAFSTMEELKTKFGKNVTAHLKEQGDDLDMKDLATIIGAGLRAAGNPMDQETLMDRLSMFHLADYMEVLTDAFGMNKALDLQRKKKGENGDDPLPTPKV